MVRPGCIWLAESVHGAHVLGLRRQGAYCATDTELYRAFDMTYDYDIWPWFEGYLSGENSLRQYIDMLNYQELTYPAGFIKMRCGENHDTPRLAHWVQDERRLRHWLAFLYFCRGSMLLYGGTEFAPRRQVGLFDADDNFGDKRSDLSDFLRRCKAMKRRCRWRVRCGTRSAAALLSGTISPRQERTGVFDLSGCGGRVSVALADGMYKNQLGGDLTVTDGQVDISGEPMVI